MPVGLDAPVGRRKEASARNIDGDFAAATLHAERGVALAILLGLPLRINAGEAHAAPGGPVAESHYHMKQADARGVGPCENPHNCSHRCRGAAPRKHESSIGDLHG